MTTSKMLALFCAALLVGAQASADELNPHRWTSVFHMGGMRWAVEKKLFESIREGRPVGQVWVRADADVDSAGVPYRWLTNVEFFCGQGTMKTYTTIRYETASSPAERRDYPSYVAAKSVEPETAMDMISGLACMSLNKEM